MTQKQATKKVWNMINSGQFAQAAVFVKTHKKYIGGRTFNYWIRLHIVNGLWV